MNKRFNELAEQSGLVATTMIDDANRDIECYTDTSDGVPSTATIHRFAELIVKECANLQKTRSSERHGYDKYDDGLAIETYFGVDE